MSFGTFWTQILMRDLGFYIAIGLLLLLSLAMVEKILNKPKFEGRIINYSMLQKSIRPIYYLLIALFTLRFLGRIIYIFDTSQEVRDFFIKQTSNIQSITTVVFIAMSIFIFIKNVQKKHIEIKKNHNKNVDLYAIDVIAKIAILALFCFSTMIIMQKLGIGFGALATLGGASGIIVGFASKDLFSNIIGLISIYLDRQFIIGDEITIYDRSFVLANGVVEEIGLRLTVIRTINNKSLTYVPNSLFNSNIIENNSRTTNKLFERNFKIDFDNNLEQMNCAINNLKNKIATLDYIDHRYGALIKISDIDEKYCVINIRVFFLSANTENFILKSNEFIEMILRSLKSDSLCIISKDERFIVQANSQDNPD